MNTGERCPERCDEREGAAAPATEKEEAERNFKNAKDAWEQAQSDKDADDKIQERCA